MPVSLRKLSKNAFKRKIKQTLSEILASEDCYIIDLPEIVQKVKSNGQEILTMEWQESKNRFPSFFVHK